MISSLAININCYRIVLVLALVLYQNTVFGQLTLEFPYDTVYNSSDIRYFKWNDNSSDSKYFFSLAYDSLFNNVVLNKEIENLKEINPEPGLFTSTIDTTFALDHYALPELLQVEGRYYWKVISIKNDDTLSTVSSFEIKKQNVQSYHSGEEAYYSTGYDVVSTYCVSNDGEIQIEVSDNQLVEDINVFMTIDADEESSECTCFQGALYGKLIGPTGMKATIFYFDHDISCHTYNFNVAFDDVGYLTYGSWERYQEFPDQTLDWYLTEYPEVDNLSVRTNGLGIFVGEQTHGTWRVVLSTTSHAGIFKNLRIEFVGDSIGIPPPPPPPPPPPLLAIDKNCSDLSIFLNPFSDILSVSGLDIEEVVVYDTSGKTLYSSDNLNLDLSFLSKGIYHVNITDVNGKSHLKKVIKE